MLESLSQDQLYTLDQERAIAAFLTVAANVWRLSHGRWMSLELALFLAYIRR